MYDGVNATGKPCKSYHTGKSYKSFAAYCIAHFKGIEPSHGRSCGEYGECKSLCDKLF